MSVISTLEYNAPKSQTLAPILGEKISEKLIYKAIEIVRAITKDNEMRMSGYKNNITLLTFGIFYGNEYYKALETKNLQNRLNIFVEKGSFYHGYASPEHFSMQKSASPTGILGNSFFLKKNVKPSVALEAMRQGISFIGCGEVCQIAYYEAIKQVLKTEKFNMLFSANSSTPLKIEFSAADNPINSLIKTVSSDEKLEKGQIVYIQNHPYYKAKHLNGEASGFTVICCDDTPGQETFTTIGLSSDGMKHEGVNQTLLKEFNNRPIGMKIVTDEVAKRILQTYTREQRSISEQCKEIQLTMDEFIGGEGGKIQARFKFNTDRIEQLANSSFEKARELFDSWNKN